MNIHRHCESINQLLSKNTLGVTDNKINRKWNDLAFHKLLNDQKKVSIQKYMSVSLTMVHIN